MKKHIGTWICLIIAIILVTTFVGMYISYKHKVKADIIAGRMLSLLETPPEVIGNYRIISSQNNIKTECFDPYSSLDIHNLLPQERTCTYTITYAYRNSSDNQYVSVSLVRITADGEGYLNVMNRVFRPETLEGYSVGRTEDDQFSWFPVKRDVDMIITHEGVATLGSDGKVNVVPNKKAAGTNLVTIYFLEKYPPVNSVK